MIASKTSFKLVYMIIKLLSFVLNVPFTQQSLDNLSNELVNSNYVDSLSFDDKNRTSFINISQSQAYLYNRIKSSKYIINPYNLNLSQSN